MDNIATFLWCKCGLDGREVIVGWNSERCTYNRCNVRTNGA